ncbi:hypothetical protein Pmani_009077 [Petrolisthes manimaculis]|uniref:Malate dehydrogenase n=1 Tax=Petrolisthes manimaculis TaxID=1843537 RepID=A0AAE1Q4Y7_9EUCA|nr:hypothetical protein Pmani_009077 [Petrolisthes manimaculis]
MDLSNNITPPTNLGTKVKVDEVERFIVTCLVKCGVPVDKATQVAEVLVAADIRGHYSHGIQRLEMYLNRIQHNLIEVSKEPSVLKQTSATALVDGQHALGAVVANFSMDLAICKAKKEGIGCVVTKGSNHYGIAGHYATRAMQQGCVGLSFSNTPPAVVASGGSKRSIGTNPISLAAPALQGDGFVLDMATSVVSFGKVVVADLKGEKVPDNWVVDKAGRNTQDPSQLLRQGGALLPLGGSVLHSNYKGLGLGVMVEILCSILSGGPHGKYVPWKTDLERQSDISHCFIAINPEMFAEGFQERLSDLMAQIRDTEPVDPEYPVQVAGDPERQMMTRVEKEGAITYHINQINKLWHLATHLGVEPIRTIN